ncbi:hypothetical protein BXZ70DRAFT_885384 [Cristinia sonorae]|uniref:GDS1 winged helix domain-containing protein n=1 Tax=Cristinia sonorae TaxID=1940300 RepID=A0A8K0UYN5_9AGAR|nr:hypothetical protein BXZ70DRAFT_885384 [Cristinia sonorae]
MSAVATPSSLKLAATPPATVPHQYGTRIRSNSVMRPSARRRQSPDLLPPRKIKPAPVVKAKPTTIASEPSSVDGPAFPPPNVMLHPDDLNSRVFIAVGRALMSVDNRAMTIKDLADLSMKCGLACQNSSAAGQAITTYVRNHLQRCELQQDHPLLLRHTMSGTLSDDELVPALHSRVGGAHCMLNPDENRVTNFRRGTVVWYLSKAAGAPCPFAREGIRLSEYTENGKVGSTVNAGRERKRERDRLRRAEQCGQKRKRLLRACADRQGSESDSSEDEQRPPKVKLTLRLKPSRSENSGSQRSSPAPFDIPYSPVIDLSDGDGSDSDDMSGSSSESGEEAEDDEHSWPSSGISHHGHAAPVPPPDHPRRSFSIPVSTTSGSPPPDSEDEEEDSRFHLAGISRAAYPRSRHDSDYLPEEDDEFDSDFLSTRDVEMEPLWDESADPKSPSVQFEGEPVLKDEPRDVQGLLDAWDDLDLAVTDRKVVDVVAQAAGLDGLDVSEPREMHTWSWQNMVDDELVYDWDHRISSRLKEDTTLDIDSLSDFGLLPLVEPPLSPYSTYSTATSPRDYVPDEPSDNNAPWDDAELPASSSSPPPESEHNPDMTSSAIDQVSVTHSTSEHPVADVHYLQCDRKPSQVAPATSGPVESPPSPPSSSVVFPELPRPAHPIVEKPISTHHDDKSIIHTLEPCVPAICAMEYEGVPVYQMTLGSFLHVRRMDTDYVNISHIQEFLGMRSSTSASPNAVVVSQGSSIVCGTWVPVATARQLIPDQPLVSAFLSDHLERRFPPSLEALRCSVPHEPTHAEFGRPFHSTIEAKRSSAASYRITLPSRDTAAPWESGKDSPWDVEDHLLSVHPPFALASTVLVTPLTNGSEVETPLSPTEEEIFHSLCSVPDWESIGATDSGTAATEPPSVLVPEEDETMEQDCTEQTRDAPLRRSKRVLNTGTTAIPTRSRTRSNKRGSRSSLS